MDSEKKNPSQWKEWIITATIIIQLLTALDYFHMYRALHDQALLQKTALQYQIEVLKAVNQGLDQLQQACPYTK